MKGNHVISTFRFLEYGSPAPKGSRFKGIITTESLIGWVTYTDRKAAADQKQEMTLHKGGLIGYTSRDSTVRTFSSDGWLDEKKMQSFKKKIADSFNKKGNLCWDTVVSLRDYQDAEEAGMSVVNDYAAIVSKLLPGYFKSIGMDSNNMIWWMDYHNNKDNPHMHIVFMEKHQTRTKGNLPQRALDKYKSLWLKELGMRKEFKKEFGKDPAVVLKEKDQIKKMFMKAARENLVLDSKLEKLKSMVPKEGRLSYNSLNMKPYKAQIDDIIKDVLKSNEVKPSYDKWMKIVTTFDKFQNDLAGDRISQFMKTEIDKLYTNMGNMILKELKSDRLSFAKSSTLWFRDSFILDQKHDEIVVKVPHMPVTIKMQKNQTFLNKNNDKINFIDLSEKNDFIVTRYINGLDAWNQKNAVEQNLINGKFLEKYLLQNKTITKNETKDITSEGSLKIDEKLTKSNQKNINQEARDKIDVEITPKLTKATDKKNNLNHSFGNDFGIKNRNKKFYKPNYEALIKKGARRFLNQDEQEKRRDLEKFVEEIEKQQSRMEERETTL